MPWNWDARVEEHPPGEKAMHDFEDIVNYRVGGRKRRSVALAPVAQKNVVVRKKKTVKKGTQEYDESNKENIPPEELGIVLQKDTVTEQKDQEKECDVDKSESPVYGQKTPALVKEKSVVVGETPAAISPGLMLTPASAVSKGLAQQESQTRSGRVEKTLVKTTSACKDSSAGKKQARRVTFATPEVPTLSLSPATAGVTQHSTARIVRFSDNVSIDLAKYGSALKMKRPSGCPPLFRTLPNHGRRVASPGKNPVAVYATLKQHSSASRRATPYMKRDTAMFSREGTLSRLIREGVTMKDSAGGVTPFALVSRKPLRM